MSATSQHGPHASRWLLLTLILAALLASAFAGLQYQRAQSAAADASRLADSARQSSVKREADLLGQVEALQRQLSERGIEPVVPKPVAVKPDESRRLEAVRELSQAQSRLAAATASLTDLQNRVHELESTVDRLNNENKRLAASETSLKDDLDSTRRVVQAMDAELKAKAERLAQVDQQLRRARDEQSASSKKLTDSTASLADLADINRRRENTVTSLVRRFQSLSDQLRALALRSDSSEASRIQSTVQAAEDDLRQLSSLNGQAQRAAQKLGR